MTNDVARPQFYRQPVILDRDIHKTLTVSPSPGGYLFAASAQTVLLAGSEFFDACRQFPIIFTPTGNGRIVPLALMGLEKGENLFVDTKGGWLGAYIPAYIRRYPFITTDGSDGQMTACFDEAFDGFNREGGLPLFENGHPSAKMTEIISFLEDYYRQIKETETFCALLAASGLLHQIDAQANLADGRSYALNGMLVVNEQQLTRLSDTDIVHLFRTGMMALINAHFVSLGNLGVLVDRKAARGSC